MTKTKQKQVEKTKTGKKESQRHVVETPGDNQNTQTTPSTTEILDRVMKGYENANGLGNYSIHLHIAPCTINNLYPGIPTSDQGDLIAFLIKVAPFMVKDSSITAADFIAAVLKQVPLMVKDSSITHMELWDVMVNVRNTLLVNSN